jgi:hypothetical protein
MENTFRVINYDGDIEISIYKKANAVFKTNEYSETEDVCVYKETINIFNLLKENQELKKQLEPDYYVKGLEGTLKEYQQEMKKVAKQQKGFIKYMNSCIKELEKERPNKLQNTINLGIIDITKTILQKYKSIIGESDV